MLDFYKSWVCDSEEYRLLCGREVEEEAGVEGYIYYNDASGSRKLGESMRPAIFVIDKIINRGYYYY